MKQIVKIFTIVTVLLFYFSVIRAKSPDANVDFGQKIEDYLKMKTIEPTLVLTIDKQNNAKLLRHEVNWIAKNKGIEITVNDKTINTSNQVTLNGVSDKEVDSINFANSIYEIKLYEPESLIGFTLTYEPCNGLGCSVSYHLLYDLKTGKASYFGRFRTDLEFNIYNFNNDSIPDYLSITNHCGTHPRITDSIGYTMFSKTKEGDFKIFSDENQERFWFTQIFKREYNSNEINTEDEVLRQNWIEKIE